MNEMLAPVCLFTYKRLDTLTSTIDALKNNNLANQSDLFIFSDGAKNNEDIPYIKEVRRILETVSGFNSVTIKEGKYNKGLASSIIEGISEIINIYGKVIVLEDDLVVSTNFLNFMNDALGFYENESQVFSIAGYTPLIFDPKEDVYFTQRASSWGWATWSNRWNRIDWNVSDYSTFKKNKRERRCFNKMGSDMFRMLDRQQRGIIDSWAIRWCYHQFKKELYTVVPTISKVQNVGTSNSATHTKDNHNRFYTLLDDSERTDFIFSNEIKLNPYYLKQFLRQYSIYTRLKYKFLNQFFK